VPASTDPLRRCRRRWGISDLSARAMGPAGAPPVRKRMGGDAPPFGRSRSRPATRPSPSTPTSRPKRAGTPASCRSPPTAARPAPARPTATRPPRPIPGPSRPSREPARLHRELRWRRGSGLDVDLVRPVRLRRPGDPPGLLVPHRLKCHLPGWWIDDVTVGGTPLSGGTTLSGWQSATKTRPSGQRLHRPAGGLHRQPQAGLAGHGRAGREPQRRARPACPARAGLAPRPRRSG
jgi:hypothetical protein